MTKRTCSIDGCNKPARARGYCNRHYENLRSYGNPIPQHDRPLETRLSEIGWTVTESGCWEWNGKRGSNNYGVFNAKRLGYQDVRAHRVVYEHFVGPVPEGLILRHTCDNPPCVNPAHLIPGTKADNVRDMVERGRHWAQNRTYCRNGLHDLTLPGARTKDGCWACRRACERRYAAKQRQAKREGSS